MHLGNIEDAAEDQNRESGPQKHRSLRRSAEI